MITHNFQDLISVENLFQAWSEFRKGKRKRLDVQIFERYLEDNLFTLHLKLKNKTYHHGDYHAFYVHDPKIRHIHKASVEDRVVHHLLYHYLYGLFDKSFIYDSYSCRLNKGTHKAVKRLEKFTRIVSKNYTMSCWALKLDVKKFFASVDHQILKELLRKRIKDQDILWLLDQVIDSFCACSGSQTSPCEAKGIKGIPLGNLTSQVFANICMNELDQYIKQSLKVKYYLRYADDFLMVLPGSQGSPGEAKQLTLQAERLLKDQLKLELHPKKIILRKLDWGVDFLGYIVLPHYRLPRTKTKGRMFKKLTSKIGSTDFNQSLQSYLGYLSHANAYILYQTQIKQVKFDSGNSVP